MKERNIMNIVFNDLISKLLVQELITTIQHFKISFFIILFLLILLIIISLFFIIILNLNNRIPLLILYPIFLPKMLSWSYLKRKCLAKWIFDLEFYYSNSLIVEMSKYHMLNNPSFYYCGFSLKYFS